MGISTSRLCDRRAYRGRIDGEYRMRASSVASRSRTRGWRTATGPMPVMISRSGRWPWRTTRCWPVSVLRSLCFARNSATSASTAWVSSARAPLRRISVRESVKAPGWASLMTLLSDTAYHSFIGEVEALNTTTIRRLTRSRRHQLLAIALQAREFMTKDPITVSADTPTPEIARLLLAHGISAAPVVGDGGIPIGMVSEGDLLGRGEADRQARRDWWLTLLAEGEALHPEFLATLRNPQLTAREVMSAPVVRITETTEAPEIARLLEEYRIKRVPVVRDDRIVGIVSRVDLLRAFTRSEE